MHEEFKKALKDNDLSFAAVEEGIGCPKNYLSRFINGPKDLPWKWEKKIIEFLKKVAVTSKAGIDPNKATKFFQLTWVDIIEKYCLEEAGIDPEKLIEEHRTLKKRITELSEVKKAAQVKLTDLTNIPTKSNYTINTMSDWATERRKKKLGF